MPRFRLTYWRDIRDNGGKDVVEVDDGRAAWLLENRRGEVISDDEPTTPRRPPAKKAAAKKAAPGR